MVNTPLVRALVEVANLRSFARHRGVRGPDVDDVLQLVRLRVWTLSWLIPERDDERAHWLRAVARYVLLEQLVAVRADRLLRALDEPHELAGEPPPHPADVLDARAALDEVLERVAPTHREVIELVALGLTAPEIAGKLGLTQRAVEARLHRARVTLSRRRGRHR